jgi:hypothetical protein
MDEEAILAAGWDGYIPKPISTRTRPHVIADIRHSNQKRKIKSRSKPTSRLDGFFSAYPVVFGGMAGLN